MKSGGHLSHPGWPEAQLADHITVKHGFAFKSQHFGPEGRFALLTPGNFYDEGGFKHVGFKQKRYTGPVPPGFVLAAGDLVVAMTEQAEGLLGSAAIIPTDDEYLHNQRIGRVSSSSMDKQFLYYLLNHKPVRDQISASASGTKVRHTSPSRLGEVRFLLPPLDIQRRIADILSAYDELIRTNARRSAILEEMVGSLFKHMFDGTDRRFGSGKISELSEYVNRGIAPQYDDNSETIVINQKCIRNGRLNLTQARRQSRAVTPEKLVRRFDVLVNSTGVGTLGRVAQALTVPPGTTVDTHVTIVRPAADVDPHFFGIQLLFCQSNFERAGVGSTGQTELSRAAIGEMSAIIPPKHLRDDFGRLVAPLREQAEVLSAQITTLTTARDLLLPKLVSGEIDLENAARDAGGTIRQVAAA